MRKVPLIFGALVLAGLLIVIFVTDRQRASASLEAAYTARDAGERCFSTVASAWEVFHAMGVDVAKDEPDFKGWAHLAEIVDGQTKTPMFFGKSRVLALNIAAKQYADLARNPTGTWVTYTQQVAEHRSRLDAAVLAVESEDVSTAGINNARSASKAALLRTETNISIAKDKAEEDKRLAKEKDEQEERERVRKIETARTLAEHEAQQRREGTVASGAATEPMKTPFPIEFSRPKPTPMLGRR